MGPGEMPELAGGGGGHEVREQEEEAGACAGAEI